MKEQHPAEPHYLTCERNWVYFTLIAVAGFWGAYTYLLRGNVFCNAQTGNVVLMGLALGSAEWAKAGYYLVPISAYILGAFVSELLPNPIKHRFNVRWDTVLMLIEMIAVLGLGFLGRAVIGATLYSSVALSFYVWVLERAVPMARPFTDDTFLELCYAVILPAAGSAIIFNIGASSGGTDIIAMILKKYSSMNIGTVLMLVDIASVVASYFIFGVETGLFSTIGLAAKSLVIDDVIENINLCKCFNIICDDPKPICDFIINGLNRSATVYHAEGAFTHHDKTVIMTTMKRSQALKLRNYIKRVEPTAFMLISNSSEIIGKGFLAN